MDSQLAHYAIHIFDQTHLQRPDQMLMVMTVRMETKYHCMQVQKTFNHYLTMRGIWTTEVHKMLSVKQMHSTFWLISASLFQHCKGQGTRYIHSSWCMYLHWIPWILNTPIKSLKRRLKKHYFAKKIRASGSSAWWFFFLMPVSTSTHITLLVGYKVIILKLLGITLLTRREYL